jgi:tRNA G18 (ribose-2'-O)-methylase SpoU
MVVQLMHHRTGLCFSHFPELVRRTGIRASSGTLTLKCVAEKSQIDLTTSARSGTLTLKCVAEKSQIDLTTSDSDDAESVFAASSNSNQDDRVEYEVDLKGEEEVSEQDSGLPKCYVIISNLQSGSNIGSICRNALAFNVHEVVVVGRKGFRDKMRNADRGAKRRQTFVHFNSVAEAATYLKETKNCSIVGVEILDSAVSSHQQSV